MELWIEPDIAWKKKQLDKQGRFLPGHTPWNKGIKGLDIGGKETRFKKGNEPHNTKYDGCITVRHHKRTNEKYKYIRIAKGKWVLLHRYIWEQHKGKIPQGYVIRFKDGDTLNCAIDNLECISRKENLVRNQDMEKMRKSMKARWEREKLRTVYGLKPETKLLERCTKKYRGII